MNGKIVLSVDDNEDDHFLIQRIWRKSGCLHELRLASDGQRAIEQLEKMDPEILPAIMLLDLKMPRKNGFEVLEWLRSKIPFQNIPVAILTSSENKADIERAYSLGAIWYFVKPVDSGALHQLILNIQTWLENRNANVFDDSPHFKACPPPLFPGSSQF